MKALVQRDALAKAMNLAYSRYFKYYWVKLPVAL